MAKNLIFCFAILLTLPMTAQEVQWMSFEEALVETQKTGNTKKVFVDVYTDWCGWCKKMDKDTFQNPEVATYMQENFLMVKLDGEARFPIEFQGRTYDYVASGRRGYHQLAAALLNGRLSYPTVVFLDEDMKILSPVPGYQRVEPFLQIARYFGDDIYKTQDWKSYSGVGK